MQGWLRALQALASAMHPQLPAQAAWERVVAEHVFTYAGGTLEDDRLALVGGSRLG